MSIYKAANNVAIICKRLYALVIAEQLGFNSGKSERVMIKMVLLT